MVSDKAQRSVIGKCILVRARESLALRFHAIKLQCLHYAELRVIHYETMNTIDLCSPPFKLWSHDT